MKCPNCGEEKVAWKKKLWGSGAAQFFSSKEEVMFLCGGKYLVDTNENSYKEMVACKNNKC